MPNQYVNKVTVNGSTILDLTSDTVDAAHLLSGYTAHDASGALINGTAVPATAAGVVTQDQDGYLVLDDDTPSGRGLVYESGTFTPTEDVTDYAITFSGTHGTLPFFAIVMTAVDGYDATLNSAALSYYINWGTLFGSPFYMSTDSKNYGTAQYIRRGSNATGSSSGSSTISYPDSDTQTNQSARPRYWVTETGMTARSGNSAAYFRSGTTYRWMAVWAPEE